MMRPGEVLDHKEGYFSNTATPHPPEMTSEHFQSFMQQQMLHQQMLQRQMLLQDQMAQVPPYIPVSQSQGGAQYISQYSPNSGNNYSNTSNNSNNNNTNNNNSNNNNSNNAASHGPFGYTPGDNGFLDKDDDEVYSVPSAGIHTPQLNISLPSTKRPDKQDKPTPATTNVSKKPNKGIRSKAATPAGSGNIGGDKAPSRGSSTKGTPTNTLPTPHGSDNNFNASFTNNNTQHTPNESMNTESKSTKSDDNNNPVTKDGSPKKGRKQMNTNQTSTDTNGDPTGNSNSNNNGKTTLTPLQRQQIQMMQQQQQMMYFMFQQQQQANRNFFTYSYPMRKYIANMVNLRLYDLVGIINRSAGQIGNPQYWESFVSQVFVPNGLINLSRKLDNNFKQFQFYSALLPMFGLASAELGLVRIETVLQQLITQVLSNGTIFFNCPRCTFTYHYSDGSYVTHFTQLKGIFDGAFKVEWIDICIHSFVPGVEWSFLEALVNDTSKSKDIFESSQENKKSNSRKQAQDQQNNSTSPPNFEAIMKLRSCFKVFKNLSIFGIPDDIVRKMQMGHVMSTLKNIMIHDKRMASQKNIGKSRSPFDSYINYVETKKQQIPTNDEAILNSQVFNRQTMGQQQPQERKRPLDRDDYTESNDNDYQFRKNQQNVDPKDNTTKRRRPSGISPHSVGD